MLLNIKHTYFILLISCFVLASCGGGEDSTKSDSQDSLNTEDPVNTESTNNTASSDVLTTNSNIDTPSTNPEEALAPSDEADETTEIIDPTIEPDIAENNSTDDSGQDWVEADGWTNIPLQRRMENISSISFNVRALSNNIRGVVSVTNVQAKKWDDLALIFRMYSNGLIDVRDGDTYEADMELSYEVGETYFVEMFADFNSKLYDVFVTYPSGQRFPVKLSAAFRSTKPISSANQLVLYEVDGDALQVTNFQVNNGYESSDETPNNSDTENVDTTDVDTVNDDTGNDIPSLSTEDPVSTESTNNTDSPDVLTTNSNNDTPSTNPEEVIAPSDEADETSEIIDPTIESDIAENNSTDDSGQEWVGADGWTNIPLQQRMENISSISFNVRALSNNIRGAVSVTNGPASQWDDLALIFRMYSNGLIDVRDGDTYESDMELSYEVGETYFVEMFADFNSRLYDVFVTYPSGQRFPVRLSAAFRSTQPISSANQLVLYEANENALQVTNFEVNNDYESSDETPNNSDSENVDTVNDESANGDTGNDMPSMPMDVNPDDYRYTVVLGKDHVGMPASQGGEGDIPHHGFRFSCVPSHFSYDDPVVYPGEAGRAHLHMFFGNTEVDYQSTSDSIINSGDSTCQGGIVNRSAYWTPTLFNEDDEPVLPDMIINYYKSFVDNRDDIRPIPAGLQILANDQVPNSSGLTVARPGHPEDTWDSHIRIDDHDGLSVSIIFPNCIAVDSNGDPILTSPGGTSHVAYSEGSCPASHPYMIATLTQNLNWTDVPYGSGWYFASDPSAEEQGTTLHADYVAGWIDSAAEIMAECVRNAARECGPPNPDGDLEEYDTPSGVPFYRYFNQLVDPTEKTPRALTGWPKSLNGDNSHHNH